MPLQLSKTLSNGFVSDYWVIQNITLDYVLSQGTIIIALYKDADAYATNKDAVSLYKINASGADWQTLLSGGDPSSSAYSLIKKASLLAGAQNVS